jgi:hypothetical protein
MPFFSKSITDLTTIDLEELLAQSAVENVRLEFKREVPGPEETLKKLSSFANTFGGYLLVGASASSSDGRLVAFPGVDRQRNFKQTIIQRCYEGIWPPIEVLVSDDIPAPNVSNKVCYVVYVPESLEAPHFLNHRKGAWVRTDEFSQRFETRLATFEELQHLMNRRALAINRREGLYERAVRRFESLAASEYAGYPGTTGSIGATLALGLCPLFPIRGLIEDRDLLSLVSSERVRWRQVGFPRAQETVTQHESVLLLHPVAGFSSVEANVWGQLFYACEIEHLTGEDGRQVSGIHLYAFLGHLLVFLEHARVIYRKIGYTGPLLVRTQLKSVRGKPFIYFPYGNTPEIGPASRIDDDISLDYELPASRLDAERDAVAGDLLRVLFFSLNWPQQAADPSLVSDLIAKAGYYNSWRDRA